MSEEKTGAERRQFARVNLELVVALSFPSLGDVLQCKTLDLSESGAFIVTRTPRPEGTQVRLRLEVGEHTLELAGAVVRCIEPGGEGPPGMGIVFKDPGPGTRMVLAALVAENEGRYRSAKTRPRSRAV